MRKICCLFSLLYLATFSSIAQNSKRIVVEPGYKITDVLSLKEIYSYPEFTKGKILLRDGTLYEAKLNYNLLLAQVQFINTKGDTLVIADEATIRKVSIGNDEFFYDKQYVHLLNDYGTIKLAVQRKFSMADNQVTGAFGQPVSGAGVQAVSSVIAQRQLHNLTVSERVILSKDERFFLGDQNNHFETFNRRNVLKAFANHQTQIEAYLKENRVNFNNLSDLVKLANYLRGLQA
jgi:hypothetical protein